MVHRYQNISFLWPNQNAMKFTLLVPICYMNYSIRISLKCSRNWNPRKDCKWSCFATDSSKQILEKNFFFVQNKKVSIAIVLPYQHPRGCYNSMNKWHLQNSHVCKKLNKKVINLIQIFILWGGWSLSITFIAISVCKHYVVKLIVPLSFSYTKIYLFL